VDVAGHADVERARRIERGAATSTAAMPTSEWNAATSSGIEVIGTRRAITAPTPPPMPSRRSPEPRRRNSPADARQRRHDRDRHAGHAEEIALPARRRARQPAQRENEQTPATR
jgi:hypothetical protein